MLNNTINQKLDFIEQLCYEESCSPLMQMAMGVADSHDDELRRGGTAMIRLLLAAGAAPNGEENDIYLYGSPLHYSCKEGNEEVVELLLSNGANPNKTDVDERTPLHLAALNNQVNCAHLLFKYGAIIDTPDIAGWTPLRMAIKYNNDEMEIFLQKRGARITEFSEKDWDRYLKKHHQG